MCTVSFIPLKNSGFILTSNRDEAPNRETIPPQIYKEEGHRLLFPKDKQAGGTWIGISDRKRAVCLMNGGFVPHKRKENYGRSRGLIVKDLLEVKDVSEYLLNYNFQEIEPFTSICVDWQSDLDLIEIVWDGSELHRTTKKLIPHIWSSSPLYTPEWHNLRRLWFEDFLRINKLNAEKVLDFHATAGEDNKEYGLIIDRGFVKTKSITQIEKTGEGAVMFYTDLETSHSYKNNFKIN